jgi:hypothetical protein
MILEFVNLHVTVVYKHPGMRLLSRTTWDKFKLTTFNDESPPPYAILSHTWTEGQEITYSELFAGNGKEKAGYNKL